MEVSSFWENEENAEDSGAEKQRLKGLTQMEWIDLGTLGKKKKHGKENKSTCNKLPSRLGLSKLCLMIEAKS